MEVVITVYNFYFVFAAGREDRHSEQGGQSTQDCYRSCADIDRGAERRIATGKQRAFQL